MNTDAAETKKPGKICNAFEVSPSMATLHEWRIGDRMREAVWREGHRPKLPVGERVHNNPAAMRKHLLSKLNRRFISVSDLAKVTTLSRDFIARALEEFEADGQVERKFDKGRNNRPTAVYRRADNG